MTWRDIPGRFAYGWIHQEFVRVATRGAIAVEVGVALGKSLAHLAATCLDAGRTDIAIFGVDAWAGVARNGEQVAMNPCADGTRAAAEGDYDLFLRMMRAHARQEMIFADWMQQRSVDAATCFPLRSLELVCLDADHTYEAVRDDLAAWVPRVVPGGWIGGDDWMPEHPGVERAVRERFQDVEVRFIDGWGTWRVQV